MASKKVLKIAILKLKEINDKLHAKLHECTSNVEIEQINKKITKNESMIMDFEFQLNNKENNG